MITVNMQMTYQNPMLFLEQQISEIQKKKKNHNQWNIEFYLCINISIDAKLSFYHCRVSADLQNLKGMCDSITYWN